MYRLFPVLEQRGGQIAGSLSGGQQQILALGMSLMTKPSILLLDEPSTGLAPVIVNDVMESLRQINRSGTTVVIVEQNIPATLEDCRPRHRAEGRPHGVRRAEQGARAQGRPLGLVLKEHRRAQ